MSNSSDQAMQRKVAVAGAIGHFVEFYDYLIYGYFATTIAAVFFPQENQTAGLLYTFAVFAVSFFVRPLGGLFFGPLGDRIGRRPVLVLSVSLMSAGTVVIGLLPGHAEIGIVAPVLLLLCRLVQGFSAGGEYSGASIFVLEHAPFDRRGRYASIISGAGALTVLISPFVALAVTSTTTPEQLASWGWRIPFLLAAPLALIGLYVRLKVEESPVFTELRTEGNVESAPLAQALKVAKKRILFLMGWVMAYGVGVYFANTYLVSYLTDTTKLSKSQSLVVQAVIGAIYFVGVLLAGYLIDKVGRKTVALTSAIGLGGWAIPAFVLLPHTSMLGACLIVGLLQVFISGFSTTSVMLIVELFPPDIRSSASSLGYQVAIALFGGTAPYIATWLVAGGHLLGPGYYLAGLCVLAAVVAAVGIGNHVRGNHAPNTGALNESPEQTSV